MRIVRPAGFEPSSYGFVAITNRLLVITQIFMSAAIVLSARPSFEHVISLAISALGVAMGTWAIVAMGIRRVSVMPDLKSSARLTTTGPYRFVRHPMYTALLLFAGGLAFSPFAIWKATAWLILLFVLFSKTVIEEQQLRDRFPNYESYAKQTKRFIPLLI